MKHVWKVRVFCVDLLLRVAKVTFLQPQSHTDHEVRDLVETVCGSG